MGDSVRLPYLPDWIKDAVKTVDGRAAFIENILAETLHRQSIYPGKSNDRVLSVAYTGHYYVEETRSNKLDVKSFVAYLYRKKCWQRYGVWVGAPPKNARWANGAAFQLFNPMMVVTG